jgi:hypothetical protein
VQQHALDHSESLQAGFSNSQADVAEYECGREFLLLVVLVINLSSCKTDLELERSADTWDSDSAEEERWGERVEWAGSVLSDTRADAARQFN